jgi:hypothetical protein
MIQFAAFTIVMLVAISWINGIDYMHKNHPDYKGEDLFDEEIEQDGKIQKNN